MQFAANCAIAAIGINTFTAITITTISVALPSAKPLQQRLFTGGITGIILGAIASISFLHYAFTRIRQT